MTIQELYEHFGGSYEHVSRTMDAARIFEAAHAMKGVCGNLGFDTLAEEAAALADEFRTGRERMLTDDEVCGKLRSIEALYQRTVDGIHTYLREK